MVQTIEQAIRQLYPISDASFEQLTSLMQRQELPKGSILFREGQVSHQVYFIEQGIARAYCYRYYHECRGNEPLVLANGLSNSMLLPAYQ